MVNQRTSRNRSRESKQKRAQAALAAERKHRNRQMWIAGSALAVVVIIVAVFVVLKVTGSPAEPASSGSQADAATVAKLTTSVPDSVLSTVGAGSGVTPPVTLTGQPALTKNKHPRVVFIGAEYCPYCAAERWGLVVALSRFGTFSGLSLTQSSSTDVFANTPSLSFLSSTYTSDLIDFTSYETEDRNEQPLQTPSKADQELLTTYDTPKFVPNLTNDSAGSIPFVDIANKYLVVGAQFTPQVLSGLSHLQVAHKLSDASSSVAKAVDGEANVLTAALCRVTGGKPGSVCTAKGVTAAAAQLTSSS